MWAEKLTWMASVAAGGVLIAIMVAMMLCFAKSGAIAQR